jgi:transposase
MLSGENHFNPKGGNPMRFYTQQHKYYCGIDLHARTMYICILDQAGNTVLHKNVRSNPESFLRAIQPYREDIVVAVECMFVWYWLADLCNRESISFVLGHALYMKAIHGGKTKNDKIDSKKIAVLLRGGTLPTAYVYPEGMRSTRDLLRRRNHLVHKRTELLAHVYNTKSQYNLPDFEKKLSIASHRKGLADHFPDPSVQKSMEVNLQLSELYDRLLTDLELYIVRQAKGHDARSFHLLRSIPGIGKILSLIILYEVHDITRFERVQDFVSYCRLVKCPRESGGKKSGPKNSKIGNAHLKWAFSEAACLFLRGNEQAQSYHDRLVNKHGKGKALSILAHKIGRAVYFMLKRKEPFNMDTFFARA